MVIPAIKNGAPRSNRIDILYTNHPYQIQTSAQFSGKEPNHTQLPYQYSVLVVYKYTYHTKNTYSTIPVKYKLAPSFPKRNPIHTQLPYQYSVLVMYNYTYHTKNTYSTIPVNLFLQSLLQVLVSSVTVLAWPRSISDICLKLSFSLQNDIFYLTHGRG